MEIEQAKFILSSFRPDGQDAQDPDFAEALALAAEDRELGEWLSKERAQDAAFSSALNSIELPEELREEILASLTMDLEDVSTPELEEVDAAFFQAFADVKPPEDLRDQILVAMDQEAKVVSGPFPIWKFMPYAAAAVIAICAVFIFAPWGGGSGSNDVTPIVGKDPSAKQIQVQVGRKIRSNDIQLVSNTTTMEDSMAWLKAKQLPTADVPDALKSMKCLGASEFSMENGTKGSIVRFETGEGKQINMLVIASKDVKDQADLPNCKMSCKKDVKYCPMCNYWVARMKQKGTVVMLLSQLDKESTAGIF